ncbi:MAG: dipeptidase [Gemmatimonadetes bacterium]|nr:dipeptidase [Gemmatimonadota bacterium]MDA1102542.1 dipeptidase [Gemmatimonadota bacterium]
MSDVLTFIDENLGRFRAELYDFLRIPSISAKSEHDADTRAAAEWFSERLREAGLTTETLTTPGHPIVIGEWQGAGPDAPTVLIYGHYDVQPPEPLELWTSPPFEPTERNGRIYARGSADDKGQLYMHVKALEAHLATGSQLPVNVVVLAEGEEEVGSPNLVPFVEANLERLACDLVLISDTGMFAEGLPSLLFSLRGLAYFEIHVHGARSDLHSGEYGGAVRNPGNALAQIIASLHDSDGRVAIPGFYDDVVEWDEETRAQIAALPHVDADFARALELDDLAGESGYGTLERLWIRPTCDINGILCGYTGEGAKTVLPNHALAKVSFRLVPDQNPDRVKGLLEAHLAAVAPTGVTVEIRELHGGRPWRASVSGPAFEAASEALEEAFGTKPVPMGGGGSIPIVVEFEEKLGATALLVGFSLPGCNLHAPDEWLPIENYEKGISALALLYGKLG